MGKSIPFNKLCQDLLKELPPRQKEVILRRFGLETGQRETLESIGKSYQITRERVRQIEADALSKIQLKTNQYQGVFNLLINYLQNWGNLKREDLLLFQLARERFQNHLYFLLTLKEPFLRFPESKVFYSLWTIDSSSLNLAKKINLFLISQLKKKKQPLSFPEILNIFQKNFSQRQILSENTLLSFIEISKEIEEGLDNLFGLRDWPEVTPRGMKDRAFLVFKKAQKPLHFAEVASLISKLNLPTDFFKKSKVNTQTVHNELIKDERFVLVGRGIYALREWGFQPGFVKDIIQKILTEKKKPITKDEIVKEVLKQRLVKVNTILLNLQNKEYFLKDSQGKYRIREI